MQIHASAKRCDSSSLQKQAAYGKTPYAGITRIRLKGDLRLQFASISAEEALSAPVFMSEMHYIASVLLCQDIYCRYKATDRIFCVTCFQLCLRLYYSSSLRTWTTPALASTQMRSPFFISFVAFFTLTIVGRQYSLATTAPCESVLPTSVTNAPMTA